MSNRRKIKLRPKCDRCQSEAPRRPVEWNVTVLRGRIVGFLCPTCQTPEENAEAVIHGATLDVHLGADSLWRGHAKAGR